MSEYLYTTPPIDRAVGSRRHVMTTSMRTFGGWGYREIQVPLLHYFEALRPGLDDEQVERSFRFVDRGGNLMVLRPDVTPAVAQAVAQMRSPTLPLRVSYTHKVVRIERSFTSDQLESYQLGVEHIGGPNELLADAEILLVALEVLQELGLPDYQISVADHRTARYLLRASGAPGRLRQEILAALVARDADEVERLLTRLGARAHYIDAILAMASLQGGPEQLEQVRRAFPGDAQLDARLDHLAQLDALMGELGHGEQVHLELAELTGASYYTGVGFTIVSEGAASELGRGGRYDELLGLYGAPAPAVGFSMSLETLLQALHPEGAPLSEAEDEQERVLLDPNDPSQGLRKALVRRRRGQVARLTPLSEE